MSLVYGYKYKYMEYFVMGQLSPSTDSEIIEKRRSRKILRLKIKEDQSKTVFWTRLLHSASQQLWLPAQDLYKIKSTLTAN